MEEGRARAQSAGARRLSGGDQRRSGRSRVELAKANARRVSSGAVTTRVPGARCPQHLALSPQASLHGTRHPAAVRSRSPQHKCQRPRLERLPVGSENAVEKLQLQRSKTLERPGELDLQNAVASVVLRGE